MKSEHTTKQLFKGALLLTIAGLISKILSAGYRIPLQNITGDLGFYIYQQIYPFLGLALVLSLYGFPTAISKLVSERKEDNVPLSLSSFYIPVFSLLFMFNVILFLSIFINSSSIAEWMGDSRLQTSLKSVAFVFLIIPFTSLFRGVFQGLNNMKPTAVSQIVEQLVRVSVILGFAILAVTKGKDLYMIGTGGAVGSIIGATVAACLLLFIWVKRKTRDSIPAKADWLMYGKTVIIYGIMISINHMLLLLLQLADAFTLVPNLVESGISLSDAKEWKGIFDRGQPLVQLGTVVGSSLALAFIPSITRRRLERDPQSFYIHIQSAIKFSLILSIGATIGLVGLFPHINILLFENDLGTVSLRILSFAIVFTSLITTVATVLQGLGFVYITAVFISVSLGLKWWLNEILVPLYGITGSAIATVSTLIIVLLINIIWLNNKLPQLRRMNLSITAFTIASASLIIFLVIINYYVVGLIGINVRAEYFLFVMACTLLGAILYLFMFIRYDGFTEDELDALPFGSMLRMFQKGGKEN